MGTYGQNRFYITFDNVGLADIFEVDLKAVEPQSQGFDYERDGNHFEIFHDEQDKVVWSESTAGETFEKWLGTNLHLSKNLLDKCAKVVMFRYAAEWFWDNVSGETICDRAMLSDDIDLEAIAEENDLDDLIGDWAYESEWIYDEDCSSDYHTWDHGKLEINNPNITDKMLNEMAQSFVDFLIRRL